MKIIWSNKIDAILNQGYSLSEIGVNNWAFPKEEALIILSRLEELNVPILGGDVCELINGIIQYNYDNWYCERMQGESQNDFVKRSIHKSKEYIVNYKNDCIKNIFFAFVPDVK